MPVFPYTEFLKDCLDSLKGQNVYVSEQKVSRYINKNVLLNKGIKRASKYVFCCDADFIVPQGMVYRLRNFFEAYGLDIIFLSYISPAHGCLKLSDGGFFTTRKLIEDFGWFDERNLGISKATFFFVHWCLLNKKWHCSDKFTVGINTMFKVPRGRIHYPTHARSKKVYKESVKILVKRGLWPDASSNSTG